MRKKIKRILAKYGLQLCSVAAVLAPIAATKCRRYFYQPIEPDGMTTFILASKKAHKKL